MEIIGGFKVIGEIWKEGKAHKCNALCKVCGKEFKTNYHALHRMKSCGCARPSQLKPLPEYINGFKVINDIGYLKDKGYRWATVECKVCGRQYDVDPNKLHNRQHCGCMKKGIIASRYAKSHPQLTLTIKHMIGRCYNKNNQDYYNYGARGITVCDEWMADRNSFCEWSIANGFKEGQGLSIDRIDSSKGYSPENCRWVNSTVQARNTRRNVLTLDLAKRIRKDKKNMTYVQMAKKYKVSKSTVYAVISNRIWKE